ncbi:hypothetical protein [Rhizobium sp. PP-CC-3G-465]|uniref:hypothetical protein n=1 Tax=Rhizobium sp. PP-CC-3G-465 TaxID=2135648 RepID=UPI00104B6089
MDITIFHQLKACLTLSGSPYGNEKLHLKVEGNIEPRTALPGRWPAATAVVGDHARRMRRRKVLMQDASNLHMFREKIAAVETAAMSGMAETTCGALERSHGKRGPGWRKVEQADAGRV